MLLRGTCFSKLSVKYSNSKMSQDSFRRISIEKLNESSMNFVLAYPRTSYNSATGGTTVLQKILIIVSWVCEIYRLFLVIQVTYSPGNSITYYPNGSRSVTSNGVTYNYDSNGIFSIHFSLFFFQFKLFS